MGKNGFQFHFSYAFYNTSNVVLRFQFAYLNCQYEKNLHGLQPIINLLIFFFRFLHPFLKLTNV